MRAFIIVTVKKDSPQMNYDMELPTNTRVSKLQQDIREAMAAYRPSLAKTLPVCGLYSERKGEMLAENRTLAELGIRTGDVLVLK